jgi:hypothetical protein
MQPLDKCEEIAASIRPATLKDIAQSAAFHELVTCFDRFSRNYAASRAIVDIDFVRVFRSIVQPSVEREGLLGSYLDKLVLYRKLAGYKVDVFPRIASLNRMGLASRLSRMTSEETRTAALDLMVARNGLLCACISQLFFSIEHSCKIGCCLGNEKFAKKVAKGIIVGHSDVFDVLRHLASQGFLLDFDSLRRIYAYVIKTRMMADYTEFFYEQFDADLFLPLLVNTAIDILNSQRKLLFECAGV